MEDNTSRIRLKKYLWPDEIKARRAKRAKSVLVITAIVMSFVFGFVLSSAFAPKPVVLDNKMERLQQIMDVLETNWYFGNEHNDLENDMINDAIKGMLNELGDKYTTYFTKEELEEFSNSINLGYEGIGVSFFENNGSYIVDRVFVNSPAFKADVQSGDIIYKVNGVIVTGKTSEELVTLVKGEAGSKVTIVFLRDNQEVSKEITRGKISNTAFGKIIDNRIGYIELSSFGDTSSAEFQVYLKDFKAKGIKNIIIDLRDNGGGSLSALVGIASYFLPANDIVLQQKDVDGNISIDKSRGTIIDTYDKIVILVNNNSASASEVLGAALQESAGAILIGKTTYGKGLVQTMAQFSDGSALKYTQAAWLSPSGKSIHGIGVVPDIDVSLHPVLTTSFYEFEGNETFALDTVSEATKDAQLCLDFIGYAVDRTDGYFSVATQTALNLYKTEMGFTADGILTKEVLASLQSTMIKTWHFNKDVKDLQMIKALEIMNE
ncbi:MAG: carboxyl-terminal processing protease [Erysipelotrichaceae bacterium]|nr:MAG: carboxyl-terminal processing [Erysipelotrichaceae bacterium]TXT19488.1 MAG: carboxyl-terminal processing protease [Erysipelotrichaceae bacterium]